MPGQEMDVFDTMGIPAKMVMFYNWETGWWFGTFLFFPYIGNNNPS